jgi:hypothetical protein
MVARMLLGIESEQQFLPIARIRHRIESIGASLKEQLRLERHLAHARLRRQR